MRDDLVVGSWGDPRWRWPGQPFFAGRIRDGRELGPNSPTSYSHQGDDCGNMMAGNSSYDFLIVAIAARCSDRIHDVATICRIGRGSRRADWVLRTSYGGIRLPLRSWPWSYNSMEPIVAFGAVVAGRAGRGRRAPGVGAGFASVALSQVGLKHTFLTALRRRPASDLAKRYVAPLPPPLT